MKRREAGFTLLEMLVALVVFGLVMAGLVQSFRFGLTAWSATTRRSVAPENLAALDAALTVMIQQAVDGTITGYPNGIAFTTVLPPGAGLHSALADVAIFDAPDGTLTMNYAEHPAGIPLKPLPPPHVEILAQGVSALQFSYLMPQGAGSAGGWTGHWPKGTTPALIRMHMQFTNGMNWPDLVAAPVGDDD